MKTWKEIGAAPRFWESLCVPGKKTLMLDYDGTLAPFVQDRAQAEPWPGVREVLEKLLEQDGKRLVFVTGRSARDLAVLLSLSRGVEIWGSHGAERLRADGHLDPVAVSKEQGEGFREALRLAEKEGFGGQCERKPGCLALHWRWLPEEARQAMRGLVVPAWERAAAQRGLALHAFDGGVELRLPGLNKAVAVRAVYEEEGEDSLVVFLGDDLTDEDAFRELRQRKPGVGLGVLVRQEPRPTLASLWLRPPRELVAFLGAWAERC